MSRGVSQGAGDARCTVIIPARDAADTIAETIASVRAQTLPDWQAVVVDDGSTDATAAIVLRIAELDPRIRLVSGPARGVGPARNVGIRAATAPLICFLDADDLLAAPFLERMIPSLEAARDVAATYTGWLRLAPDGSTEQGPCPDVDGDLFGRFAAACVFPPHACVVRHALVQEVGGFDERLKTTEDWDLWQRIARTGARFVRVPGTLVSYRMRPGSLSRDSRRVLDDGLAVIARGHAPDRRVHQPHPAHEAGLDAGLLGRNSYNHLSWAAGMALASGEDPATLFAALTGLTAPDLDPWEVAGTLVESIRVTLCAPRGMTLAAVGPQADGLLGFLAMLERASHAPDLALRVARAVDHLVSLEAAPVRPCTLLTTHEVVLELAQPLADVAWLPPRIDRFRAELTYGGEPIGEVELPVCDGRVGSLLIADAAADAEGWRLLRRFLTRTVFPTLDLDPTEDGFVVRRDGIALGAGPASDSGEGSAMWDAAGWTIFVQELFGMTGSSLDEIYDPAAPSAEAPLRLGGPILEVDVSDPLRDVHVDAGSVVVRCTVGGALLGAIEMPTVDSVLPAGPLRRVITDTWPDELVRLVVREAIIGWRVQDGVPLRVRLARRRAASLTPEHRALPQGGIALLRHAGAPIGGPSARHAALPIGARKAIERLAHLTGTPIIVVPPLAETHPACPGAAYLPDVPRAFAGLAPVNPSRGRIRDGVGEAGGTAGADDGLLVLAYERIAADGSPAFAERRVHPSCFEEQVSHLHALGYRGLARDEWQTVLETGEPAPGRRVVFTFDGGYADFAEYAWPALGRHGFNALVFLVTGAIGTTSRWEEPFGQPAPLMDWPTIRSLHAMGVAFGSNSVSHPWLTGRPLDSVVTELFDSRAEIESALGDTITCFAYPYGAEDRAVRSLVGAAGYRFAASRRAARWTKQDHPLAVPRRLVTGRMSFDDFVRMCDVS